MKIKKSYLVIVFSMFFLLIGCSEEETTAPTPNSSNMPLAKFSDLQSKIFNSCAVAGCHASGSAQGNLDLSSSQAYSNLVGVQSALYPQFKRVEPGSAGNSMLIKILKGELTPQMPLNRTPLSNDVIDSIEAWIDNGALNN